MNEILFLHVLRYAWLHCRLPSTGFCVTFMADCVCVYIFYLLFLFLILPTIVSKENKQRSAEAPKAGKQMSPINANTATKAQKTEAKDKRKKDFTPRKKTTISLWREVTAVPPLGDHLMANQQQVQAPTTVRVPRSTSAANTSLEDLEESITCVGCCNEMSKDYLCKH